MCVICQNNYDDSTEEIKCIKCETIEVICNIPNLQKLYCESCPNLRCIVNLPNAFIVDCCDCPNLVCITALPRVNKIITTECEKLQAVSETDCLEVLAIADTLLKKLDYEYINLYAMDCSRTSISSFTNLIYLRELYCNECDNITEIDYYDNQIYTLECSCCSQLTILEYLENLHELDCSACDMLKSIKYMPNLTILDCRCCSQLTILEYLENLHELDCSDCDMLKSIKNAPNLTILDCSSCPSLVEIPDNDYEELYYDEGSIIHKKIDPISYKKYIDGCLSIFDEVVSQHNLYDSNLKMIVEEYL